VITDHLRFHVGETDLEMPGEMRVDRRLSRNVPVLNTRSYLAQLRAMSTSGAGGLLTTRMTAAGASRTTRGTSSRKSPHSSPGAAAARKPIVALGGATGLLVDAGCDHHQGGAGQSSIVARAACGPQ